ncbi:hypothetical protein [Methylorubrum salsuginis]|uniref:Uncharacterized protein n=1 Tax=Methylorubrum salsuginis TaxID=414703 RepID=A0A1I4I3K8_9HYPH|nr:hypothetical protein [Methylorubrum salsuginis]SFL49018.1 hypothetical protein SAMN04488125_11648 [Methylorubrum salsuginis]
MAENDEGAVDPIRAVEMRLRARLAVVERAAWFGFVAAMRADPAGTEAAIASERARCREGFGSGAWAKDLTAAERALLGSEVDTGLAGLIEDAKAEIADDA